MSIKAGFRAADEELKCSECRGSIKAGERYFQARVPLGRRVRVCLQCVRKAGIFDEHEITQNEEVKVTGVDLVKEAARKAMKR